MRRPNRFWEDMFFNPFAVANMTRHGSQICVVCRFKKVTQKETAHDAQHVMFLDLTFTHNNLVR